MRHPYRFLTLVCTVLFSFCYTAYGQHTAGQHTAGQHTAAAPSIPLIQPQELAKIQADTDLIILDTRSSEEYQQGHLKNARLVNFETFNLKEVGDISKEQKIVVYCMSGHRSGQLAKQLLDAGYKRVKSLEGGLRHWKEEGYETSDD